MYLLDGDAYAQLLLSIKNSHGHSLVTLKRLLKERSTQSALATNDGLRMGEMASARDITRTQLVENTTPERKKCLVS
jgi:hypothetical protein